MYISHLYINNKMARQTLTLLAAIILSVTFLPEAHSQTFETTLQKFANNFQHERIHMHLDKDSYAPGDTIWFKAYLLSGVSPANQSKTLYVDWTDPSGKLIHRNTMPVLSGISFGQTALPANYEGNAIHMKAYTKWMLNFDSSLLYNRDISVLSEKTGTRKSLPDLFNLFPEGGELCYGINNKVAFKVTDGYGAPVHVNVTLKSGSKVLTSTKDIHDGMGFFYIKPEKGVQYSVVWRDPSGNEHTESLPEIKTNGISLQISFAPDKRILLLNGTGKDTAGTFRILGTMFDQPVFDITREMEKGSISAIIPVNSLPSGILRITVLDSSFHPLGERITFINNNEYRFRTDMQVAHWGMNKRARNELEISIPDSIGGNLSISVTDARLGFDTTQNIFTDLLLSDEIKGKINNPAFYFGNNSDSLQSMLDLVMLTNGWRKINWQDISKGILPVIKFSKDTSYLTISGKVFGATATQLKNAGDIILIVSQDKKNNMVMAPIQPDGSFDATNFVLYDTASVYYQVPKEKGMGGVSVQFSGKRAPVTDVTAASVPFVRDTSGQSLQIRFSQQLQNELKFNQAKVLEGITITARPKSNQEVMDERYTSGLFSGGESRGFDIADDPAAMAYTNIFDYLRGRVAGVMVSSDNPPTITWRGGAPDLFLNEMPVDANALSTVPVSDIAYVKVLNPPFMGAIGGGAYGAIAIYTRKGDDVKMEPGKGLPKNTVTGYSVIRDFFSPNYDLKEYDQKDLRTTLYWNPEVIVDPRQTTTVQFFNNDVTESFRIVIEGMSPDGRLTRTVKIMQ